MTDCHGHVQQQGGRESGGQRHAGHLHGGRDANQRRLLGALALTAAYTVAELVGGLLSNSLALLADAGHMFSDTAALALSLFAAWMARRPPTPTRTYGYYRTEILAALVNGAALMAIASTIVVEAYHRFQDPPAVKSGLMLAVAVGGLLVNAVGLGILAGGRGENLNIRGAWLHVFADALGSIGAILSALLMLGFGWNWADPLASVLIAILVIYSSWSLLKDAVAVVMEGAPEGVDVDALRAAIIETGGVAHVHDLHVWSITTGMACFSAHVVVQGGYEPQDVLARLRTVLQDRFGIHHSTIQIEQHGAADPKSDPNPSDCTACN